MKLDELKNKRILILGFGIEGKDAFLFFRKLFPKKTIGIADRQKSIQLKSKNVKLHLGEKYLNSVKDYDAIIKSPGIPFKILPKSALGKIVTPTDIFFANCPGKIVGITGTKGKSTTASLIYNILKRGGLKAHLIGNIGKPALSSLEKAKKEDIFVYELSSHQLYNLKKSPHVAVLLNIYPEHLDYYKSFKDYALAKAQITIHQKGENYLVYNSQDANVRQIAKKSEAKKIPISGKYYQLNKETAKAVGRIFKVPDKIIGKAISESKGLEHRLELVGTFRGITFYNDALSTIPEATMAALSFLGNKVESIMLGGFDRKIDFKNLAETIAKSKIKTAILFPTTGKKIWKEISAAAKGKTAPEGFFVDNMKEAVKLAYLKTGKGKICLLSTASPSFSLFRDYKEKGGLFKKYVKRFAFKK